MNVEEQVDILATRVNELANFLGIADDGTRQIDEGTRQIMALVLHSDMCNADIEYSNLSMALYSRLFDRKCGSRAELNAEAKLYMIAYAVLELATHIGEEREGVVQEMYANLRAIVVGRDAIGPSTLTTERCPSSAKSESDRPSAA